MPNNTKPAELRQYLICIKYADIDVDIVDYWDIVTGREEAYNVIKSFIIDGYGIDYEASFVLVESLNLEERRSIYSFMKYCEKYFPDSDFNIDSYYQDELDQDINNDEFIDDLGIMDAQKLNMQDIINGEVESTPLE